MKYDDELGEFDSRCQAIAGHGGRCGNAGVAMVTWHAKWGVYSDPTTGEPRERITAGGYRRWLCLVHGNIALESGADSMEWSAESVQA